MKRFIGCIAAALLAALVAHSDSGSTSVGTASHLVLGMPGVWQTTGSRTATYTNNAGHYININNRIYVCLTNGISGAGAITNSMYGDVHDGSAFLWRPTLSQDRKGLIIVNNGASTVSLNLGHPATAGQGILLAGYGGTLSMFDGNVYQGEVYAASTGASEIAHMEW